MTKTSNMSTDIMKIANYTDYFYSYETKKNIENKILPPLENVEEVLSPSNLTRRIVYFLNIQYLLTCNQII